MGSNPTRYAIFTDKEFEEVVDIFINAHKTENLIKTRCSPDSHYSISDLAELKKIDYLHLIGKLISSINTNFLEDYQINKDFFEYFKKNMTIIEETARYPETLRTIASNALDRLNNDILQVDRWVEVEPMYGHYESSLEKVELVKTECGWMLKTEKEAKWFITDCLQTKTST